MSPTTSPGRTGAGDQPVVVVSAMGHETDDLLDVAAKVSRTLPGREMDMLITAGERKAMALLCMALHDLGVPADSFTGSQAGILTNGEHTKAKIVDMRPDRLRAALAAGRVPVVGGAQGVSLDREVTFLGRGGSDTTAVALAKALGADACELYTDVPGVFSADPRVVPAARRLARVSYEEMLEMNAAGCPKPAMRSVEFARTHGVRLHVRSSFTWEPGTWIEEEGSAMEQAIISAVVSDQSEAKLTVAGVPDHPGVAARLFRALADQLDKRRHDRAERLHARHHRHLVHRPPRRPGLAPGGGGRACRPRSGPRGSSPTPTSPLCPSSEPG